MRKDRFWQAALTVQGKIANFDVTYAGAYMDRPTYTLTDYTDYADAYDSALRGIWRGAHDMAALAISITRMPRATTINPQQYIIGTDHFKKMSQEAALRVARRTSRFG